MDRLNLYLDKNKKYVIACSFGPDSMALLGAALKEGLDIVVAHVNYRKREASQQEQNNLIKFCDKHNVPLYVLDSKNQKASGNFQTWARKKRYEFFKIVAETENAYAVLVAHQQDDVIETYLMQKNRGNFVKNYGISRENTLFGIKVIRPLLDYSKAELQEYDSQNKIPFSIDESNLTNHYTRNRIRHDVVEKLTSEERKKILNEINSTTKIETKCKTEFSKAEFLALDYQYFIKILDHFMLIQNEHRNISEKFFGEIKDAFKNKTNHRFEITKSIWLELDYEEIYIINASRIGGYKFEFINLAKTPFVDIDFSNGASDRGINNNNQKLILKNCDKNDKTIIKNYSCEVRRLFIDWKMPLFLREVWPGIYDENGSLIYVPRYRKNFQDNHKSKFKINTKYFLKF